MDLLDFIKKLIIWVAVFLVGSIFILFIFGIRDLGELSGKEGALMFGAFVGLMASYIPKIYAAYVKAAYVAEEGGS